MDIIFDYKDYFIIEKNFSEYIVISYINDVKGFEDFLIKEGLVKDLLGVRWFCLVCNYIFYLDN